jgi:ABC-type multidrug transport system fused ATPase/permease subunit
VAANTFIAALLIVGGSTALAVCGLLAVVRWMPSVRHEADEGAKGVFFSMVGVLYAVLLAFVVVLVWSDFVDAGTTSQQEVTRLSNLARGAAVFPEVDSFRIRARIVTYAREVAKSEWKTMAHGNASPTAQTAYQAIWSAYYGLKPQGDQENAWYSESVSRLNDLGEARRSRLLASKATVPAPMWLLLIIGFVVSIGWTYLFKMRRVTAHAVAVGSIAALTSFVLFLIFALQHPFAGDVKISPEPFTQIAEQYARTR